MPSGLPARQTHAKRVDLHNYRVEKRLPLDAPDPKKRRDRHKAFSVMCPTCMVLPEQVCITRRGNMIRGAIHLARKELYKKRQNGQA